MRTEVHGELRAASGDAGQLAVAAAFGAAGGAGGSGEERFGADWEVVGRNRESRDLDLALVVETLPRSLHSEPQTARLSGRDDSVGNVGTLREPKGTQDPHKNLSLIANGASPSFNAKSARLRRRPLHGLARNVAGGEQGVEWCVDGAGLTFSEYRHDTVCD